MGVVKVKILLFFDERKKERKKVLQKFFLPSFDERRNFQRSSFRSQTEFSLFFPFFKRKHKKTTSSLSALEVHYIFKNDGRRRSATPRTRPSEEERTVGG